MKKFPKLKSKIILAPMHDTTNLAFRLMCKEYGAALVSTELLSANAIAKNNKAVLRLAVTDKSEKPNVIQLFSQNTSMLVKAAKRLEKDFDIIDFNIGCPSERIMQQGSGGALLRRKNKIKEIVKKVSSAIKIPFTVKMRVGFDRDNSLEIAKICEEQGASAITIHARTVLQGYSGHSDWEIIKKIKQNLKIPVIGNGDIWNGADAKKMLEETGCDYVMVGRAAIGNPFIFKAINHFLETGEVITQNKDERISDYFEYIKLAKKFKIFNLFDAKTKAQEFTKGFEGSSKFRKELNTAKSFGVIKKLLQEF
ncbi:tRNA dihydrouridine synthase DusB [Candidatus Pacearchaeota archaeon]|nr:tRNA dihydrouridine synthase DusB [Candidatus Pacearchaeota archaeon]